MEQLFSIQKTLNVAETGRKKFKSFLPVHGEYTFYLPTQSPTISMTSEIKYLKNFKFLFILSCVYLS